MSVRAVLACLMTVVSASPSVGPARAQSTYTTYDLFGSYTIDLPAEWNAIRDTGLWPDETGRGWISFLALAPGLTTMLMIDESPLLDQHFELISSTANAEMLPNLTQLFNGRHSLQSLGVPSLAEVRRVDGDVLVSIAFEPARNSDHSAIDLDMHLIFRASGSFTVAEYYPAGQPADEIHGAVRSLRQQ